MNNDTYTGATVGAAGTVGSDQTSEGLYILSISSTTAFAYTLTATPVSADPECTTLTLDSLGQKGATGSAADGCW